MNNKDGKHLEDLETYKERTDFQMYAWLDGRSIHNTVDEECCPDFSCCNPDYLMDRELRQKFVDAVEKGDEATKYQILGMALAGITSEMNLNVHIAGEHGRRDN